MEERGRRKDWSKSEVVSEGVEGKGKASQLALWNVTTRIPAGSLLDTSPPWLFQQGEPGQVGVGHKTSQG